MLEKEYAIFFTEVKFMKKRIVSLLGLLTCVTLSITLCVACTPEKEPLVLKESDTFIVVKADDSVGENETLANYMSTLKERGDSVVDFDIEGGMVKSINGIANAADLSSCWMLYTSDTENANDAWGTVEYESKLYGSAILGAESLKVKAGEIYIWVYQTF